MERQGQGRHTPLSFVLAMVLTLAAGISPLFPQQHAVAAGTSTASSHAVLDAAPDHDAATGTMAGQAGTDGGSANYQVPIVVPPGRAGMQPSLSLNYSSRSGDGVAGMGWSISGLSSIHRCPQTPEQDGKTRGVNYSSTDRLCLDGQRLVSVSGQYGNSGTTYRTEIDSYARVTQVSGSLTSASTSFRVEQKNGRVLTYGSSTNARVQPSGANYPLSWLVEKIEDRVGNYQSYSYTNSGDGEVLLDTVTYTGSPSGGAGDRSVKFAYQSRQLAAPGSTDIASSALAGGLTMQTKALASIRTRIGTTTVRKYVPLYKKATYSGRLLMTSLTECAGELSPCHPPTLFSYNDGNLNFQLKSLEGLGLPSTLPPAGDEANENYKLRLAGDFDGDGTRETIVSANTGSTTPSVYLSQFTADRSVNVSTVLPAPYNQIASSAISDADMDGSGRAALIGLPLDPDNVAFGLWNYAVYPRGTPANSNPFGTVRTNIPLPQVPLPSQTNLVQAADVDGDGSTDIVAIRASQCGSDGLGARNGVFLHRNQSSGAFSIGQTATFDAQGQLLFCLTRVIPSGGGYAQARIDHIADFNGDGLADFHLTYASALSDWTGRLAGVAITQAGASSAQIQSCAAINLNDDGTSTDDCSGDWGYTTRWMDVNADGLEDFVIARPNQGTWRLRLNLGGTLGPEIDTGSSTGLVTDATGSASGPPTRFRYAGALPAMDVDADGKADLLTVSPLPGAQPFAVKMCTIKRIHKVNTPDGLKCPGVAGLAADPATEEPEAEGAVCAVYSCPPNPDGSDPLPAGGGDVRGFPYQWDGLPAFSAYSSHANHEGPGEDNSVYHLSQLKFVQTAAQAFAVESIETPMVARLNDHYGRADDLFGDGLPDLLTSMGCSNMWLTQPPNQSPPYTWARQKCSVVNTPGYGPATLPDGTPTARLATKVVLYANVNQGLAAAGGSDGSVTLPASQRPPAPTLIATGAELPLSLPVPHMPGLMDSAINGVGDFAAWGYFPLSVRAQRDGIALYCLGIAPYCLPSTNGYTDQRHYYFQSSMPVVYGMAQDSGNGSIDGFRSATYGYSEAMYHHLGRGFQGFHKITSTTMAPADRRLRTTTTFHQKFPLTGRIEEVETFATATGRRVKRETDTWICAPNRSACAQGDSLPAPIDNPNGGTVYAPQLDRQTVETFDLGTDTGTAIRTVTTVNAELETGGVSGWDVNGNLEHQVVTVSDAYIQSHITTTTNTYLAPETINNWWLDRLSSSTVVTTQTYASAHSLPAGVTSPTRTVGTTFVWNSDRTPQSQTVTASGKSLTTAYDYLDTTANGLPKKVTISGTGISPARTTQFTYTKDGVSQASQDGYFVLTTTNAAGHATTTEHAPRDGQVTTQIDPNTLRTINTYDAFGRLTGMSFKDAGNATLLPPVSIGYAPCSPSTCGSGYGDNDGSSQEHARWRVVRTQAGAPTTADWFDVLGRTVKHTERGFRETDFIETYTVYDTMGTVDTQSGPFYQAQGNAGLTAWNYDALGRPTTKQSPGGELDSVHGDVVTQYAYAGSMTTIKVRTELNAAQQTCTTSTHLCMDMSRTHDALGRLIRTVQGNGNTATYASTDYWHDGLGNPIAAKDAGGSIISSQYNALGQRTDLNDPDAGHWTFTYNALGEVLDQTDARGVVTSHLYDSLGRLTRRTATNTAATDPNLKVIRDTWVYDPPGGAGLLDQVTRSTGPGTAALVPIWTESNSYEPATKRLSAQTSALQGLASPWITGYTYDGYGRPDTTTYPSGLSVRRGYTDYGVARTLGDAVTGAEYWSATDQDAWGNPTAETYLGTITGSHTRYATTGQVRHKQWMNGASLLTQLDYTYDSFGNLTTQSTAQPGVTASEGYAYDGLQRLIQATRSGVPGNPAPVSYAYQPNGNLAKKTDYSTSAANAYSYDAGTCGPHAASRVERNGGAHTFTCDANGNITGGNTLSASYDFNNQPWQVSRAGAGTAQFAYTADGQVFRRISGATTWFGPGGYEETHAGGIVTQRHELGPVVVLRENGVDAFKAILRDRLGSQVLRVSGVPGAGTGTTPTLSATPNPSLDGHYAVSWTPITGASRYELRESRNGAADDTLVYNGANLTWSPPGAKSVARYTYRVRACTPVCGEDSAPVTEEVVPAAPSSISVSPNPSPDGAFTISWSSSSGALAYQVEEKDEHPKFHVLASGVTALTLPVTGKAPGTYQYRVRACLTACGNPSAVVSVEVTGGGGGAPATPTLNPPDPNPSTGTFTLSWSASPTAEYYSLHERFNGGGWQYQTVQATSIALDRNDGTYEYRVRACRIADQVYCSLDSNIVGVTVQGSDIPDPPASITSTQLSCATGNTTTYTIDWPASDGATRYELHEYNALVTPPETIYTTTTETQKTFTKNWPLHAESTTFTYKVRACNDAGCSQYTGSASACFDHGQNGPQATADATAYDAFGKVRNGDYSDKPNGTLDALPDTLRGFTGHQHVDEVRLIHMNGRIYDYELGRFLSVDPVIQFPANSQSLNPYSYILNNPLSGTDPTGYYVQNDPDDDAIGHGVTIGVVSYDVKQLEFSSNGADTEQTSKGTKSDPGNGRNDEIGKQSIANGIQLARVEEAEGRAEHGRTPEEAARVEAAGRRGISPAALPAVRAAARTELEKVEAQIRRVDPEYKPRDTISGLGNNDPIDRLDQARQDLVNLRNNGETRYTSAGRRAHQTEPIPEGFIRDVRIPGTRLRMDGYNPSEKLILEIKPNNQRQIRRGERQLERYCEVCDSSELGPGHKAVPVQTYEPIEYLNKN